MASSHGAVSSASELPVMDIEVKEIIDLTYFWAQIGETNQLKEFEDQIVAMCAWCEACTTGCYQTSAFLKVGKIVAVKEADSDGRWTRAKVTRIISDRQVELFYVDTGFISIAYVHQICTDTPPMMMAIPQQALHCILSGVKKVDASEDDEWSEEANSLFTELVSIPTKVVIHKVMEGKRVLLSIFTPYQGHYTSVGEILRKKGLAQYEPPCSLVLDIPVPPEFAVVEQMVDDGIIQEKLPSTPLLKTHSYDCYNYSDDPDSYISIDNSVIIPKEDELDTSFNCLPDREETSCNSDEEEKAEDRVKIENLSTSGTPPGSPTSPDEELGKECYDSDVPPLLSVNDVPPLLSVNDVTPVVSDKALSSGPSTVATARIETAPVILTGLSVASDNDDNVNTVSSRRKHLSCGGYKVPRKTDHTLKEEIAKVTTHVRTKQQKLFLEDTLGGVEGNSSSSLSDSDWLDERILPRMNTSAKVAVPECVLKVEPSLLESDFFRMNSNAGNTPYPCPEKRRTRSRFLGSSASPQRSFGCQKNVGRELFQDRCPRGRGEFNFRGFSSTKLSKKMGSSFDQERSQQKKVRGRGAQLHGSLCKSALSLSPTTTAVDTELLTSCESYTRQLEKMNKGEISDEVKWQTWNLEKEIDRVVSSLDATSVGNFEEDVKKILAGSIAAKLCGLLDNTYPLEVIVSFLVRHAISESLKFNLVVGGLELLMNGQYGDGTCQIVVKVMNTIAEEILQCGISDGRRKGSLLSEFVSLLMNSASRKAKHRDSVISGVKQCFVTWSKCLDPSTIDPDQSKKIQVSCCGFLLNGISSHFSAFKQVLVELVEGPIRRSILNMDNPEDLREAWLLYAFKTLKCVYQDTTMLTASPQDEERSLSADSTTNSKVISRGVSPDAVAQNAGSDPKQHATEMQQLLEPTHQHKMLFKPSFDHINSEGPQSQMNPSVVYTPVAGGDFGYIKPHGPFASSNQMSTLPPLAYVRVTQMLDALNLTEVMPKFKAAMIKDTVLEYGVEAVKGCLKDAGIPSGAILEITSYLKRLNKPHQIGQCSSGYPSAQQPYQMLSSMATNAYVMDMTRQNYLPSHAVSHCHVAQQQRNMLVDSRHVCNNPRMESQPVSPASPFPVVASPLSTNPLGSQMDHHQLQCQPQLHLQIGCRSTTNSSQEVLGTGRSLGLSTTGEYGVVHTAPTMSQGVDPAVATTAMPLSDNTSQVEAMAFPALPSGDDNIPSPVMPTGIMASRIRPGGFGSISCVICGGNDHATYHCNQRDKLFFHM